MTFVGLLNFPEIALCACVWRLFFLLIDRYIVFVERRLTSRKAERFIVTRQFSVGAKLFSFIWFLFFYLFFFFSFICDAQNRKVNTSWRSRSTARASVLTIHHTTARPSLWVSQTCDLLFLNGQTKYETIFFFFFFFVSTWMWTDVCNSHLRS